MDQVNDGPVDSGRPARIHLIKQSIPTCPQCGHRIPVCLVLDVDLVPLQFHHAGVRLTVARAAAAGAGADAKFVKVTDVKAILACELLSTPGLVIDDRLVSSGRIPTQAEVRQWLGA